MATIVIKTQAELDALPNKFDEFTVIEIRSDPKECIQVKVARESSSVEAWGTSRVEAWGTSRVVARESSRVVARGSSSVEAWWSSSVVARDSSRVVAWGTSRVVARESSRVVARGSSSVEAWESSRVVARDSSRVVARGSSSVEAWESSRVEAWDSSRVDLYDFSFVYVFSSFVIINKLMNYSIASLRGITEDVIKTKTSTAKIIKTPAEINTTFEEWLEQGYVYADGLIKKLISRKKIKDIEVFEVEEFLERKSSYIVKRGDVFSHGETIAKAKEDLKYKISNRDTSRFKKWKLTDKKTVEELIDAYRTITGACELGVKQFFNGKKFKSRMTILEAIKETAGQFGNEQFTEFFK